MVGSGQHCQVSGDADYGMGYQSGHIDDLVDDAQIKDKFSDPVQVAGLLIFIKSYLFIYLYK